MSLLSTTYASKYILDCFTSTHTLSSVDPKYFKDSYYTYTTCSIDPQDFFSKLSLLPTTYTSKYIMDYFTKHNHLKFNGSKMFQGLIILDHLFKWPTRFSKKIVITFINIYTSMYIVNYLTKNRNLKLSGHKIVQGFILLHFATYICSMIWGRFFKKCFIVQTTKLYFKKKILNLFMNHKFYKD